MPKATLKKYTHDGVLSPRRTVRVSSGPVNPTGGIPYVKGGDGRQAMGMPGQRPAPAGFEKGRTTVSQAAGYVLGRKRGRGTRKGCGHIRPQTMSSAAESYGDMFRTRSDNLQDVRLSSRDAKSDREAKKEKIRLQAERNRQIRKTGVLS